MCFFKSSKRPTKSLFLLAFIPETIQTIGLALLIFYVLPDLDVVKGAMLTNCLSFVPGVLGLLSRNNKENQRFIKVIFDLIAVACQATGFVVWPIVENKPHLWLIPISIFMISIGWWENYISKHSPIPFVKSLGKLKANLDESRYFIYMFVSVWKCICFFIAMLIIFIIKEGEISFLFSNFSDGFSTHPIVIQEVSHPS